MTITKTVVGTLNLAREIEAKIKSELINGDYCDRRQAKIVGICFRKLYICFYEKIQTCRFGCCFIFFIAYMFDRFGIYLYEKGFT